MSLKLFAGAARVGGVGLRTGLARPPSRDLLKNFLQKTP
jgi:hypothetical protein